MYVLIWIEYMFIKPRQMKQRFESTWINLTAKKYSNDESKMIYF